MRSKFTLAPIKNQLVLIEIVSILFREVLLCPRFKYYSEQLRSVHGSW